MPLEAGRVLALGGVDGVYTDSLSCTGLAVESRGRDNTSAGRAVVNRVVVRGVRQRPDSARRQCQTGPEPDAPKTHQRQHTAARCQ